MRDTYSPEPQWLRQDREQRDDPSESGIGGSQYGGNEYGYGGSGRGSYAGSGREWGENTQGYGRQGAGTNRDFGGRDYGERDQSRMREERDYQQRTAGGGGGRTMQSGYNAPSRNTSQDYGSGYEASGWDDDFDAGAHRQNDEPFRVGTGMGLGSPGYGYGASSSGYGSRGGWDLGTQQRDTGGSASRQSFRGMGPANYKRSDERIRDDIYERLTDSHVIDARAVMVEVSEGNVTLSGTVNERRMRYAAEDLVERIGGVSNINNQLRVQAQEQAHSQGQQAQPSGGKPQQEENKRH